MRTKDCIDLERPFEITDFEWSVIVKNKFERYIEKNHPGWMLVTGVRCGKVGKNGGSCIKLKNHTGMHKTS